MENFYFYFKFTRFNHEINQNNKNKKKTMTVNFLWLATLGIFNIPLIFILDIIC